MARMTESDRRHALLEYGSTLFAETPVDTIAMTAIAQGAGCSKALLYHYFGSRRGYYTAVLDRIAGQLISAMQPEAGLSFEAAFEGSLQRFLRFVQAQPAGYRLMVQASGGVDQEAHAVLLRGRSAALGFLRAQLGAPLDAPALVGIALHGWVSFAEASALHWVEGGFEVSEDTMVELLREALGPVRRVVEGACTPAQGVSA